MALITNTAEGGTDAAAVTTGNSGGGSGTAFATVSAGAGGSVTYTATGAYRGNLSYSFVQPTDSIANLIDLDDVASAGSFSVRFYINISALPTSSSTQFPVGIRSLSGAIGRLEMNAAAQVRISMGASTAFSTESLAADTWYRVEFYGTGIGTASSAATVDIYVGDATGTPYLTRTISGQTTAAQVQRVRYGKASGSPATVITYKIDDIAQNIGSAVPLGPSVGITGTAGPDQFNIEPFSTVTLTATGTGSWSQTAGPTVTLSGAGLTRMFTAPGTIAGTGLTFSYGGDLVNIDVLPVTERLVIGGVEVPCEIISVSS